MSSMRRSTTASCRMREADGLRPASSCAAISPDSMRARSTVRPNRLAVLSRSTAHALVKSAGAPISVKAEKGLLSITPRDADEGGPMPIFSGFAPGTLAENQQYAGLVVHPATGMRLLIFGAVEGSCLPAWEQDHDSSAGKPDG